MAKKLEQEMFRLLIAVLVRLGSSPFLGAGIVIPGRCNQCQCVQRGRSTLLSQTAGLPVVRQVVVRPARVRCFPLIRRRK